MGLGHEVTGQPIDCDATPGPDWFGLPLGYVSGQWQLILPANLPADWQGMLYVDGRGDSVGGTATDGRVLVWLAAWTVECLMQGSEMRLEVGRQS